MGGTASGDAAEPASAPAYVGSIRDRSKNSDQEAGFLLDFAVTCVAPAVEFVDGEAAGEVGDLLASLMEENGEPDGVWG